MSLTPEERQRIYEEEKTRIEAQEAFQAEKQKKDIDKTARGLGCCGGVVCLLLFGFILFVLNLPDTKGSEYDAGTMAEVFVKRNLKSPSSAVFCSYADRSIVSRGPNEYTVTGWVDAENSFGAKLRSVWVVDLKYVGDDKWEAESVELLP